MALFLLDTDTCSYVMRRAFPALLERLRSTPLEHVAVSAVSVAELLCEVERSSRARQARAAFDAFIRHPAVLDWPADAAAHYARVRASLKSRGEMIGANDLLIAAHALCLDSVLVTNNERDFRRVTGLQVQNWVA